MWYVHYIILIKPRVFASNLSSQLHVIECFLKDALMRNIMNIGLYIIYTSKIHVFLIFL